MGLRVFVDGTSDKRVGRIILCQHLLILILVFNALAPFFPFLFFSDTPAIPTSGESRPGADQTIKIKDHRFNIRLPEL